MTFSYSEFWENEESFKDCENQINFLSKVKDEKPFSICESELLVIETKSKNGNNGFNGVVSFGEKRNKTLFLTQEKKILRELKK